MAGVRVDEVADFLDLRGINTSLSVFYSTFLFEPCENGDVVVGSLNEPRIVMLHNEAQTPAFRAALKRKLAILPPPHYGRSHPLGSDVLLSKIPPKIVIMTRQEYMLWAIQRLTQAESHTQDKLEALGPCSIHDPETPLASASQSEPTSKGETAGSKKRKKKKKNKGKEPASGTSTPSVPGSARSARSSQHNTPN
ncbi:hypothetical protein CJU89_0056 [Yarrowia sp. B02]|nr:hypothetical protein CJU89_0056 [Yarrowia sp. B02]